MEPQGQHQHRDRSVEVVAIGSHPILRTTPPPVRVAEGHPRQKVLFIGGIGRSGATLVERLLNEWPQTTVVGETVHLWERGVRNREHCGCGARFAQCPHWSAVGRRAFGGWDEVDPDDMIDLQWSVDHISQLPALAKAVRTGRLQRDQRRYLTYERKLLLAAGAEAAGSGSATVVVDSSKHLTTAALLSTDPALDVRILHLVRDPRGVAYSWTRPVARPGAEGELLPVRSPAQTASRWVSENLGFETLARRVPTLRLHYEDVLADPARSLLRIGVLVDLVPDDIDLRYIRGRKARLSTVLHAVAGNRPSIGGEEIRLRIDEAWRRHLPRRDLAAVTAITTPLLRRYGYPLRP